MIKFKLTDIPLDQMPTTFVWKQVMKLLYENHKAGGFVDPTFVLTVEKEHEL